MEGLLAIFSIVIILVIFWILRRYVFQRNAPDWFRIAMLLKYTQWKVNICRSTTDGVIIPTFSTDIADKHIYLTRVHSGCHGTQPVYTNTMTINSRPISEDQTKYRDVLMKRLCKLAGIKD